METIVGTLPEIESTTTYVHNQIKKIKSIWKAWIERLFPPSKIEDEIVIEKEQIPTVIVVDMNKVEFVDLKEVLAPYEEDSKVYLAGVSCTVFDKQRMQNLPYDIEFVNAIKIKTAKLLKNIVKEKRQENIYRVVSIKGRTSLYVETYLPNTKEHITAPVKKHKKDFLGKKRIESKNYYPTVQEVLMQKELAKEKNHLVLWDMENISYLYMDDILAQVGEVNLFYCVHKESLVQKVTKKLLPYILGYHIKIVVGDEDSDEEIKNIVNRLQQEYKKITIISNDTDFIPLIKSLTKNKKNVEILCREKNKTGMIMQNNMANEYLTIRVL